MIKMACIFYFAHCINIIFNLLLVQLVKYDFHTTRKMKFIHAMFYHILLFSWIFVTFGVSKALIIKICSMRLVF